MIISVFMMCAGSLLIAVMPTYETIGVAAPVLLVVARLIQGLSVGAEYGKVPPTSVKSRHRVVAVSMDRSSTSPSLPVNSLP